MLTITLHLLCFLLHLSFDLLQHSISNRDSPTQTSLSSSTMLLNLHQTYTKPKPNLNLARQLSSRVIAIASSSLSVVGGLLAFYFFFRMEKRYRHQ